MAAGCNENEDDVEDPEPEERAVDPEAGQMRNRSKRSPLSAIQKTIKLPFRHPRRKRLDSCQFKLLHGPHHSEPKVPESRPICDGFAGSELTIPRRRPEQAPPRKKRDSFIDSLTIIPSILADRASSQAKASHVKETYKGDDNDFVSRLSMVHSESDFADAFWSNLTPQSSHSPLGGPTFQSNMLPLEARSLGGEEVDQQLRSTTAPTTSYSRNILDASITNNEGNVLSSQISNDYHNDDDHRDTVDDDLGSDLGIARLSKFLQTNCPLAGELAESTEVMTQMVAHGAVQKQADFVDHDPEHHNEYLEFGISRFSTSSSGRLGQRRPQLGRSRCVPRAQNFQRGSSNVIDTARIDVARSSDTVSCVPESSISPNESQVFCQGNYPFLQFYL